MAGRIGHRTGAATCTVASAYPVAAVDLSSVRSQFPSLSRHQDGQPVLFADAPGGSQVPQRVIEAMAEYLRRSNANLGGAFPSSRESDQLLGDARRAGADLLGASPGEIFSGRTPRPSRSTWPTRSPAPFRPATRWWSRAWITTRTWRRGSARPRRPGPPC